MASRMMQLKHLIKVGRLGRAHGVRGELKVTIEDAYFEDVVAQDSLLVDINGHRIPHFVEAWRSQGNLVKLEEVDDQIAARLLQQKDLYLPAEALSSPAAAAGNEVPFAHLVGYTIFDETNATILGAIESIIDLPQHYLAELTYQQASLLVPLHEDLIVTVDNVKRMVTMALPDGLYEIGVSGD